MCVGEGVPIYQPFLLLAAIEQDRALNSHILLFIARACLGGERGGGRGSLGPMEEGNARRNDGYKCLIKSRIIKALLKPLLYENFIAFVIYYSGKFCFDCTIILFADGLAIKFIFWLPLDV